MRSVRLLTNNCKRKSVILSIACRARHHVTSSVLTAPDSSEASAFKRARSEAMAGASGGALLSGGLPSWPIWLCRSARRGRRLSAVCVVWAMTLSISFLKRPRSVSTVLMAVRVFSAPSMVPTTLAIVSLISGGRVAAMGAGGVCVGAAAGAGAAGSAGAGAAGVVSLAACAITGTAESTARAKKIALQHEAKYEARIMGPDHRLARDIEVGLGLRVARK